MKILIAGSNGMVGSAVTRHLVDHGHTAIRLVRRAPGPGEVRWDPDACTIDRAGLEGFEGVVHVATKPWPLRWTAKFKQEMRANRIGTNRLLAESLAACRRKPRVLICASGMGVYPSSGDQLITEETSGGQSFLASFQQEGEAATAPASEAGIRVVHLRIPPVIGAANIQHGASQLGDGRQWTSWIGQGELARIVRYALESETLVGPVNAVSPHPLRNAEFASIVARALGRKPGHIPAFLLHILMGEMAAELLLASRRIEPSRLLLAGYRFRFPELEDALQYELGHTK
ncbi:MAG TPA: DUF1731 domain-containing protein [Anaerolineales bacterium]|nr:DUF1731 domain-containing protein [Anaerolineales bacterium]